MGDSIKEKIMEKKKKTLWWVALSVLVIAVVTVMVVRFLAPVPEAGILTEALSRGDMENSVTATGTVEPLEQVEVGTQVSGIIAKIYVDYNSQVKEGQVIAELDKDVLETELASAKLSVESNKNEYEYQQKNYNRTKNLYEQSLVSESEYETAEYNYNKAKISCQQAVAQEAKAKTNLGYATIYSPIDGVVISRAVEEGQTVASSYSTPTLFTIANDLRKVQVVADVDEADIGSVHEGAEVTFSVDAYPGEVFEGEVNQVRMEAITTNNVVTYEVVIHADNPDLKLKPGLTANISIYSMRRSGVLRLPVKAVRFKPEGDAVPGMKPEGAGMEGNMPPKPSMPGGDFPGSMPEGPMPEGIEFPKPEGVGAGGNVSLSGEEQEVLVFVWEKDSSGQGRPVPRKVKIGVTDRIYYEVIEGLSEGDEVCVGIASGTEEIVMPSGERSPFMPGPPGRDNQKNKGKK